MPSRGGRSERTLAPDRAFGWAIRLPRGFICDGTQAILAQIIAIESEAFAGPSLTTKLSWQTTY
jgi:hypothetical protein